MLSEQDRKLQEVKQSCSQSCILRLVLLGYV